MGNEMQKEFKLKDKPLKLPGSYNFLRFAHHPSEDLSLIVVKAPHRATPIASTLILPIKQVRNISSGGDSVAVCQRCLPLALVKPKSQTQMRILMHKIIRSASQIGRCFFLNGRIMLWCEEKRGIASSSPEEMDSGKSHPKSKVFVSGIALINFLYCVYENEAKQGKKSNSDVLPQEIRLFFQPKDKKDYYDQLRTMQLRLSQAAFWRNISQGLRELLLNMVSQDADKRIDHEAILSINYFMESQQLRLYSTLADDIDSMTPREAKIFMVGLELIIKEGLTIELCLMDDFFRPVLCSMVTCNPNEGKQDDYLLPLALSIILQLEKPPADVLFHGFRKAHSQNLGAVKVALGKREKIVQVLGADQADAVLSRAILCSFQSEELIGRGVLCLPFALRAVKHPNYRRQLESQLVSRVLAANGPLPQGLLLDGLKCAILLVKEGIMQPIRLDALTFAPLRFTIEANFHVLYLFGLMVESFPPLELLDRMMPKLKPYLIESDLFDEVFIVAKRCVDRILQRLYQQRKIDPKQMGLLNQQQNYFDLRADAPLPPPDDVRLMLKKQIQKHELQRLRWTIALL